MYGLQSIDIIALLITNCEWKFGADPTAADISQSEFAEQTSNATPPDTVLGRVLPCTVTEISIPVTGMQKLSRNLH